MKNTKRLSRAVATLCLAAALPSTLLACPVCFGAADSPMTQGMNMGILSLLGITGTMLAGIATLLLRFRKRLARVKAAQELFEARRTLHG